jgi:hypothetical protein
MATYNKAVKEVAHILTGKFDAFEGSTLLAKIYNKPKEQTLNDIIKVRQKMFNIKPHKR